MGARGRKKIEAAMTSDSRRSRTGKEMLRNVIEQARIAAAIALAAKLP